MSLSLVIYDLVVLPFQFFEPPESKIDRTMVWVTRMFWTSDIQASFLTGYLHCDGTVELSPWKIIRRYAQTWMALDMLIVGMDWLEVLFSAQSGAGLARFGKASRTFRIVRMLRFYPLLLATLSSMLARSQRVPRCTSYAMDHCSIPRSPVYSQSLKGVILSQRPHFGPSGCIGAFSPRCVMDACALSVQPDFMRTPDNSSTQILTLPSMQLRS